MFFSLVLDCDALNCWTGSTYDKSAVYPPKIENCTLKGPTFTHCQVIYAGALGQTLSCASKFNCELTQKSLDTVCCNTTLCNDPNNRSPSPPSSSSTTPIATTTTTTTTGTTPPSSSSSSQRLSSYLLIIMCTVLYSLT